MVSKKLGFVVTVGMALLLVLIGWVLGPIPQPKAYNHFADQRSWHYIPNTWNVLSNITFALVGFWGLFLLRPLGKIYFVDQRQKWLWIAASIGLIFTAIGSSYYHLDPTNERLVWDRLPMTLTFMSVSAALICESINTRFGLTLWPFLLVTGFISVFSWHTSEMQGTSDLRFYLAIQMFTLLVILGMLFIPSPYTQKSYLALVLLFYGFARLCEIYDYEIFAFTNRLISGHSMKHLAAALASFWLFVMLARRRIIKGNLT